MKQIASIQSLRAVAALMVVFSHAQNDALHESLTAGGAFVRSGALPWDAGVDLFFIISGFIMVHASDRLFATPGATGTFVGRRLIRIVPLYWLSTTIVLAGLVSVAALGRHGLPSPAEIAASYGFIPFARPGDGAPRPLASLGWTLNYEMFFYLVFAAFVRFRRTTAAAAVTLALVFIVDLGALVRPSTTALAFWTDPIVLEFALGIGLAQLWSRGLRLANLTAACAIVAGVAILSLDLDGMSAVGIEAVETNGFGRLLACGVPMALIFGGVVLRVPSRSAKRGPLAFAGLLGDASYALYLFHPLVIIIAHKVYGGLGLGAVLGFWPLVTVDVPLAAAFALLVHVAVEKPVCGGLQTLFRERRQPPPAILKRSI